MKKKVKNKFFSKKVGEKPTFFCKYIDFYNRICYYIFYLREKGKNNV